MANFDQYEGILPYATELFGVYQPLLGWKANLPKQRVAKGQLEWIGSLLLEMLSDSRFLAVFAGKPRPLDPSKHMLPSLPDSINTLVGSHVQSVIEQFVKENQRPPDEHEWKTILQDANLTEILRTLVPTHTADATPIEALGLAFYPKSHFTPVEMKAIDAYPVEGTDLVVAKISKTPGNGQQSKLPLLQESLVAGTLSYLSSHVPHALPPLFLEKRRNWEIQLHYVDPLADFDPTTQLAVLSPVGLIHLYREYFYELKSFLGSPVGHVWVSPGGSVELYEVNTRKKVLEKEIQTAIEETTRTEITTTEQDELSDAVKTENQTNTNLGTSASTGGSIGVYHADASVNYGVQRNHSSAEEVTHKQMRQQSEKLSSEIRRSFKTTFRTSVEVQDTSSKRYVLQNNTDKLVNYELRRKMRQVAVQVQHIGTQLCWQVYIEEPGKELGIAELVHVAKPEDLEASSQPPEAPPVLEAKETQVTVEFPYETLPFMPADRDKQYTTGISPDTGSIIIWHRKYTAIPPGPGYTISAVNEQSIERVDPEQDQPYVAAVYELVPLDESDKSKTYPDQFQITLNAVNFRNQMSIRFVLSLTWSPPDQSAAKSAFDTKMAEYQAQLSRQEHAQYVDAVRERVKLANTINPRPVDDLREEERTVIYRRLIRQLTKAGINQTPHVTTELIRALFDVDKMLYFVAPEWWRAQQRYRQHYGQQVTAATNDAIPTTSLTEKDTIGWGGIGEAGRQDNYLITEESQPAQMGASLGWLLQLDGDNHRNAFLNSPWIKAVVPIRPGKEVAALKWLKLAHVEGVDGLKDRYGGIEENLQGKTIEEALLELAKQVTQMNTDMQNVLATETVFEKGFDPLESGFRATGTPFEVFDQWIEILPTDQIVAVEYNPNA